MADKKLPLLATYITLFAIVASVVRPAEVRPFLTLTLVLASICSLGIIYEYRFTTNVFYLFWDKVLPGFFEVEDARDGVFDSLGTIITTTNPNITISLGTNPNGAVLSGNLTVQAFDTGTARFETMVMDRVGSGYTLVAGAAGLNSAVSTSFNVVAGKGSFTVGSAIHAELEPFLGPTGKPTTLVESIFSTVPGSPAFVGKATTFKQKNPELKQDVNLQGHNAILSEFRFDHAAAA